MNDRVRDGRHLMNEEQRQADREALERELVEMMPGHRQPLGVRILSA